MSELKKIVVKFPTPTDDTIEIDGTRLVPVNVPDANINDVIGAIQTRHSCLLEKKALYLSNLFDWVLGLDGSATVLVPLKKKERS